MDFRKKYRLITIFGIAVGVFLVLFGMTPKSDIESAILPLGLFIAGGSISSFLISVTTEKVGPFLISFIVGGVIAVFAAMVIALGIDLNDGDWR